MACCNSASVAACLFAALVLVQLVDESVARQTFVVAPHEQRGGERHRREAGSDAKGNKPVVKKLIIDSVIKYRYANTVVFSKVVNPANVSREIAFTTVLPDAAFISGFAITMNNTVYKAYVKEKEEAKRIYQEAVAAGQTAGHVELSARDSNTFTVSVNVEALGKVSFNLTYEELLTRELGTYKHKISLNPGQIVKDMRVQVIIHESSNITTLQVPELRERNEIMAQDESENQLVTKEQPNGTTAIIRWVPTPDQQKEINGQGVKGLLEVRYDVDRTSQPNQILVNEGYFVHFFAPGDLAPLNKHVVFVLDTSGSMYGRKIQQLKEAIGSILDELRAGDTFSIVLFSDVIQVWLTNGQLVSADTHGEPVSPLSIASATPENIEAAKAIVNGTDASGATHMYDALQAALRLVHLGHSSSTNDLAAPPTKEPMIIFLTDGQANGPNSDSETIVNHTTRDNRNPSAVVYGLAFGSDADFSLMKKLSLKNSGFARKIYEAADASLQLKKFYREVSSPLLSNVTFNYLENQVETGSLTKVHFRTHNNGSEIVVAGRLANSTSDVSGNVTGHSVGHIISLETYPPLLVTDFFPREQVIQNASEAGFMERLWAYLTIRQLLDLKEQADNETVKEEALQLALQYSFVTPLTSLVVVKPNGTDSAADLEETRPDVVQGRSYMGVSRSMAMPGTLNYPRMNRVSYNFQSAGAFGMPPAGRVPYRMRKKIRTTTAATVAVTDAVDDVDSLYVSSSFGPVSSSSSSFDQAGSISSGYDSGSSVGDLSSYSWFSNTSNGTHILLTVNGVEEVLKIGYNETDTAHSACSSPSSSHSHCRHLPHCPLAVLAQGINVFMQYFCRIDQFIGVCCPDNLSS